ncbi:MAG: hypothetical protein IJ192_00925 [Clostridia bacterium]|nr:hypothetical protein [Clostridia bacterium]
MKPEQAIEILSEYRVSDYVSNVFPKDLERHIAVEMAIEKISLDIPKKPIERFSGFTQITCPTCQCTLYDSDWGKKRYECKTNRCMECGQLFDWKEDV